MQFFLLIMLAGLVSCAFLYMLMRGVGFRVLHSIFVTVFWIVSASFLTMLYTFDITLLAICCVLAACFCIQRRQTLFALLPLLFLVSISPLLFIAGILVIITYHGLHRWQTTQLVIAAAVPAFLGVASWAFSFFASRTPFSVRPATFFIQELGAPGGISLVVCALGIGGALALWRRPYRFSYIASLLLLVGTLFFSAWLAFSALILTTVAALSFLFLTDRVWYARIVQKTFLYAFLTGVIFAAVLAILTLTNMAPSSEQYNSLDMLSELPLGTVLTAPEIGSIVSVIGKQTVFVDQLSSDFRVHRADEMFHSIRLTELFSLLKEHNISYIYVTSKMRTGQIWNQSDQEMLLLLTNKEAFTQMYDDGTASIYAVSDQLEPS
jgi:hypothetical protein